MFRIIARLMDGNTVDGYLLTDGANPNVVSRAQAWSLAKDNQIVNVKAVGSTPEQGITGTNGFELKKLPVQSALRELDARIYGACFVRHIDETAGYSKSELMENKDRLINQDIQAGVLNKYTSNYDSNNLRLVGIIKGLPSKDFLRKVYAHLTEAERAELRGMLLKGNVNDGRVEQISRSVYERYNRSANSKMSYADTFIEGMSESVSPLLGRVVGYKLKNVGNVPMQYETVEPGIYLRGLDVIQPGEEKVLTRIETTLLMAKPTINFNISNAQMAGRSSSKVQTIWDKLETYSLAVKKDCLDSRGQMETSILSLSESDKKKLMADVDISNSMIGLAETVLNPNELNEFIRKCGAQKQGANKTTSSDRRRSQAETRKALSQAKGITGIMKAFKR